MMNSEAYKYGQYTILNQESRWAAIDEIKNSSTYVDLRAETYPTAGLPLLSDGIEAYVDGNDTHSLIFGATGSKKTRLFCMPLINIMIKAGESFIATDPKGELYAKTSGMAKEMGYKTVVLNFRDVGSGDCWNPLFLPYELYHGGKKDEATALLNDFMTTISEQGKPSDKDNFWLNTSRSLGLANLLYLMEYADPSEANMTGFMRMCTFDFIKKIRDNLDFFDSSSIGSVNYRSTLSAAPETLQSIIVSLSSYINVFVTQKDLCAMLSKNTFDIRRLGREKTALYIIVPDEKTTLHFLVTTFIKQAYEILIREAHREKELKLPVRVNFVLDEFCNIPKIPDMHSMISAARSRNMRYYLIVQSKHQLVGKYGEDADTIKGNCDNWVFLTSRELDLLNEISELCGKVRTPDGYERRLISVSELQRFDKEKGEALIMHARQYPIITEMPDIDKYNMFGMYASAPMEKHCFDEASVFDPMLPLNFYYALDDETALIFSEKFSAAYNRLAIHDICRSDVKRERNEAGKRFRAMLENYGNGGSSDISGAVKRFDSDSEYQQSILSSFGIDVDDVRMEDDYDGSDFDEPFDDKEDEQN